MVFMLCSCINTYRVTTIPKTSENLKAARECQRTVALATGYTQDGYKRLKMDCYKTLEDTELQIYSGEQRPTISGCQPFDELYEGGASGLYYLYYLCKPELSGQKNR